MSAYLTDKATIDAILTVHLVVLAHEGDFDASVVVDALLETGPLAALRALEGSSVDTDLWHKLSSIGRDMIECNVRSLDARYPSSAPHAWGVRYIFTPLAVDDVIAAAFRVMGAIKGWQYQSCEHRDHTDDAGWHFTESLRERIFDAYELPTGTGWTIDDYMTTPLLSREVYSLCIHDNETGKALDAARARWNGSHMTWKVAS